MNRTEFTQATIDRLTKVYNSNMCYGMGKEVSSFLYQVAHGKLKSYSEEQGEMIYRINEMYGRREESINYTTAVFSYMATDEYKQGLKRYMEAQI
jgi:hypothetical protein